MTQWALSERVAAVQIGADVVFLDLEHDRYSCMRGERGLHLEGRQLDSASLETIRPLIDAGLLGLRPAANEPVERLAPRRPTRDLETLPTSPIRGAELLDFLMAWAEALIRFPGRSILALHKQVRPPSTALARPDVVRLMRRVAVFQALLPWIVFPGACLFRSYLLLRFLQRGGDDARWIIGVRTWPFEAHCWLQLDDVALDERCERLVRFQPLLAI